jgi:hypothetical protein
MTETTPLRVNEPSVVHETIDGETILLDLNTGNYFSLEGPGAVIWEFIQQTGDWQTTVSIMEGENPAFAEDIRSAVTAFVESLVNEKLLVPAGSYPAHGDITELEMKLKAAVAGFMVPRLIKYSDMQDLFLLDPIHDVGEMGWPESKEPRDNA